MPTDVDLAQLDGLLGGGAQLVEVLPAVEYEEEHLPDASNIPLKALDDEPTAMSEPDHAAALGRQMWAPRIAAPGAVQEGTGAARRRVPPMTMKGLSGQ